MTTVLVTPSLSRKHWDVLAKEFPHTSFLDTAGLVQQRGAEVRVLVTDGGDVSGLLGRLPNLEWVQVLRAGIDNIPLPALRERRIRLTTVRGIHGIPIGEHVMGMILQHSRRLLQFHAHQMQRVWDRSLKTDEVYEKTLGIVGIGAIGREIAKRARAFGMRVIGINSRGTPVEEADMVLSFAQLPDMLAESDYVVIALPLTPETTRIFGEAEFRLMKPSAFFINIARGEVVDEQALIRALQEGWIGGAGLDVFSTEPLPVESPLWGMANVLVTPHVSALSPRYYERAMAVFRRNLQEFLAGEALFNEVDLYKGY